MYKLEHAGTSVNRTYLIELATKNLISRKTRTLITVFGMSVGIGIIVLLLSLGYGVERLIIGRVASLDELRIFDVTVGGNTSVHLDDTIISKLSQMPNVQIAMPIVATVGKLSYKNANTDIVVYATPKSFLELSKVKLLRGNLFANSEQYKKTISRSRNDDVNGQVAGAQTEIIYGVYNSPIIEENLTFNVMASEVIPVWETCAIKPKLLGYTIRTEGGYVGEEYWGDTYTPFYPYGNVGRDKQKNIPMGRWIKGKVPLFEKRSDDSYPPIMDKSGRQEWAEGCVERTNVQIIDRARFGEVLGASTSVGAVLAAQSAASSSAATQVYSETVVASSSSGLEFVALEASGSGQVKSTGPQTIPFTSAVDGEAVVTSGLVNLLDIPISEAVGKILKVQFIVTKSLLPSVDGRAVSPEAEYKIVGVLDDKQSTRFYIPFADINKLKVTNFSQIKVVMNNAQGIADIRKNVESLGLRTSSTIDTVKQIESLFANLRILLAILGMVALVVAALGMFNTLTVSLLERTREIGGMKTMGVVSEEIQDLFLSEAIIMGISGGSGGLILGFLVGKALSMIVSVVAIASGQGYLELTYIPIPFVIFIMISSFIVGILTGLYPAQRAKKISALNALRYE